MTLNSDFTWHGYISLLICFKGEVEIPTLDDQSLMVWMRLAAARDFKKIHSVINHDLKEGDVLQVKWIFNIKGGV